MARRRDGNGRGSVSRSRTRGRGRRDGLAPVLIDTAKELADERGLAVRCEVGDAEQMSYDDASFDLVSSTCGVMFAPDHTAVARELARVTRSGSRIALACWTRRWPRTDVSDDGPHSCLHPLREPVARSTGDVRPMSVAPRRLVRARVRGARLDPGSRLARGLLGVVLHFVRTDEDCR